MRSISKVLVLVGAMLSTGCAINDTGPARPIAIGDDVKMVRALAMKSAPTSRLQKFK
jgi:hypothetical protein